MLIDLGVERTIDFSSPFPLINPKTQPCSRSCSHLFFTVKIDTKTRVKVLKSSYALSSADAVDPCVFLFDVAWLNVHGCANVSWFACKSFAILIL